MMGSVLVRIRIIIAIYYCTHILTSATIAIGGSDEVALIGFLKAPHYFKKVVTFPTHKEALVTFMV